MVVWVNEANRRITFKKTTDVTFKNLKLWRYQMDPNTLLNSTDPTNTNIAMSKHYYQVNHPRGIASRQRTDAFDLFLSKPHFLNGDPQFHMSQIDFGTDLAPNAEIHDTYLDVEPLTGRTFAARKRLQFGVYLNKVRIGDSTFGSVYGPVVDRFPGNTGAEESITASPKSATASQNNLYLPILWASEGKDIPDSDAASFEEKIYGTRKTFFVVQIVLVIVGGLMFFTFLILCIKARQSSSTSM